VKAETSASPEQIAARAAMTDDHSEVAARAAWS
jgi:hypothetical protein